MKGRTHEDTGSREGGEAATAHSGFTNKEAPSRSLFKPSAGAIQSSRVCTSQPGPRAAKSTGACVERCSLCLSPVTCVFCEWNSTWGVPEPWGSAHINFQAPVWYVRLRFPVWHEAQTLPFPAWPSPGLQDRVSFRRLVSPRHRSPKPGEADRGEEGAHQPRERQAPRSWEPSRGWLSVGRAGVPLRRLP